MYAYNEELQRKKAKDNAINSGPQNGDIDKKKSYNYNWRWANKVKMLRTQKPQKKYLI